MLLQECVCGEPLVDHIRVCSRCGQPNPAYKPSRWRIFWPDLDDISGAEDAITLGYWAAFALAVLGVVVSLVSNLAGLADAVVFALCGLGIWRRWRTAAVIAFLLFVANVLFSLVQGHGVGVLAIFAFIGLTNGVRGTFARSRLAKTPDVTEVF